MAGREEAGARRRACAAMSVACRAPPERKDPGGCIKEYRYDWHTCIELRQAHGPGEGCASERHPGTGGICECSGRESGARPLRGRGGRDRQAPRRRAGKDAADLPSGGERQEQARRDQGVLLRVRGVGARGGPGLLVSCVPALSLQALQGKEGGRRLNPSPGACVSADPGRTKARRSPRRGSWCLRGLVGLRKSVV